MENNEYGKFFPVDFSTAYLPENGAVLWCGATLEDLERIGGNIFDPNAEGATVKTGVDLTSMRSVKDIPDSIDMLTDDWIGVPIYDPQVRRSFTFLRPEVEHYRALRIAPPDDHFIPRFIRATTVSQIVAFESRTCAQCQTAMMVSCCPSYPNRRIYCQSCYLQYLEKTN